MGMGKKQKSNNAYKQNNKWEPQMPHAHFPT